MNEYFDLVENSDLDAEQYKADSWIWFCPNCNAIFASKAIHNRTIFPWFGYHPNDGNLKVITDETSRTIKQHANTCECTESIERVKTVTKLKELINT